ncbi:MAG: hypothetical protein AB9882_04360 [Ignavibacteriaceae bacterium]
MQRLSKTSKIILVLLILTTIVWLGNTISRMMFTYNIFENSQLTIKYFLTDTVLKGVLIIHQPLVSISIFSYFLMLLLFVLFIIFSKLKLRENGWLFISILLILLTAPFEIFLIFKDFSLFFTLYYTDYDINGVMEIIFKRYSVFGSFMIVEILVYFSIVSLFIFQPFIKSAKNET